MLRCALVLAACLAALPSVLPAQEPVALGRPEATLREPFSLIRGVRELPDGRLLVADYIEERIAVVDLQRGTVQDRGRVGAGPGEFRLPGGLVAFRADSTLFIDMGNNRLLLIGPDGGIGRVWRPVPPAAVYPVGADGSGRLYYIVPAWMAQPPLPGDTVEVEVWGAGDAAPRTLARIHGSTRPSSNYSAGPRIPYVVFARQDAVAVAPDGRVAIVRGEDYHVEWHAGERVTSGPSYATTPVRADAAERTAFARRFSQASPVSGKGEGGSLGHASAESQNDEGIAQLVRFTEFAETLPFFRPSELRIDPHGRLWVERWLRAGEAAVHDVFDGSGRRIASIRLPAGRRLAAAGRNALYLVNEDDLGLQTIERYPLPRALTAR